MTPATHTQDHILWSLSPQQKHVRERIYSGREEIVLLTVTIVNPAPGPTSVELLVNGSPTGNGVLDKRNGVTSRTWLLTGVKTLDLLAHAKDYCSGEYAISVFLS